MQRASDAASFVADPLGRYFAGATHLVWCHSPTLCGSMHWGRPSERDMRELTRLLDLAHHPALAGGFDVYMDARAIVALDWRPLRILSDYVRAQLPSRATSASRRRSSWPSSSASSARPRRGTARVCATMRGQASSS